MALKKACIVGNSIKNSGKECDISMGPTAMIIPVPPAMTFKISDLDDLLGWALPLLHAAVGTRIYPLFGFKAPINQIKNAAENDVIITLDDGTPVFVRYGMYNRTFETIAGGLCYAETLASFLKSGYNVLEIDNAGQMLICNTGTKDINGNKLYRGLIPTIMYSPAPQMNDGKSTVFMNRFQYSFNPSEMIKNGEIFTDASALLALMGLIDVEFVKTAAASATNIKFTVQTECAETNIAAKFGAVPQVANFVVTNKATGAAVVPTGATLTGTEIDLAGAFTSGQTYIITGASPSVWYAGTPSIQGYDGSNNTLEVTIP